MFISSGQKAISGISPATKAIHTGQRNLRALPPLRLPSATPSTFCAPSIAGSRATAIFALSVFCLVGAREWTFWRAPEYDPFLPYFSATSTKELQHMTEFVKSAGHTDLPVVVSDCLLYSQFVYYSQPGWTERLVYLVDAQRELRYTNADTSTKTLSAFREFPPLLVSEYSEFTTKHSEFVLYSKSLDWYLPALIQEGAAVQVLRRGEYGEVVPGQNEGGRYSMRVLRTRSSR